MEENSLQLEEVEFPHVVISRFGAVKRSQRGNSNVRNLQEERSQDHTLECDRVLSF